MNLFAKYEVDPKKEKDGTEIAIDGAVFILRRAGGGNRRYKAALSIASLKYNEQLLNDKDIDAQYEAEDAVTLEAFANGVVVGWRDVTDREGNPWPFSRENFIELMQACPDVWWNLRTEARDRDNFRITKVAELGESVGN